MKTKKHIGLYILLAFFFILLYTFLAAKPLGKEYHFTPEWKKSIATPPVQKSITNPIYFKLGQTIGYFTSDGEITNSQTYPVKAAISSNYYALYDTLDSQTVFYDYTGKEKGTFEQAGYPFFEEDRIFIFMPGGSSFAKCNSDGSTQWIYEGILPITAFSSKKNLTSVGYADGTISIIDNITGIEKTSFSPGGSDYKVILGLDVSSDGTYIASVSGHDKQRFVITRADGLQPKIIHHEYLDSNLNRRTVVRFCDNDRQVIYNYEDHIGIYNITDGKNTNIKIDKTVIAIEETDSIFFVLGKNENQYTVYIIEKTQTLEGHFTFEAESAFIKTNGDDLYIGQDSTISKIKITKQ
ncbi:MAG: hypothetical protein J5726_11200 [Treponema sp.]|nr:hypothetical protein [Treponema sp.]